MVLIREQRPAHPPQDADRATHIDELVFEIELRFREATTDEWTTILHEAEVPAGTVVGEAPYSEQPTFVWRDLLSLKTELGSIEAVGGRPASPQNSPDPYI